MLDLQVLDVEVAIAAAVEGADIVRRQVGRPAERVVKGGGDFATTVDYDSERAILRVIERARPEDAIFAEETGSSGQTDSVRSWLVDPLCGTLNYAVQMRVVAVNVALRRGPDVLCAAVVDAFSGDVFWTDGRHAYRRAADGEMPLAPSAASALVDLNLDPPFPSAPRFRAVALAGDPGFVAEFRPRVVSSSLALTWVATGQRAGYVTDGAIRNSVHFSAGLAICAAAGCVITDLHGSPLHAESRGAIVAADGYTHGRLVALAHPER